VLRLSIIGLIIVFHRELFQLVPERFRLVNRPGMKSWGTILIVAGCIGVVVSLNIEATVETGGDITKSCG
ncbi:MAG: hypothetical protein ACREDH_13165, partial [Methylocella sp.]